MSKGILLGLIAQISFALGFTFLDLVTSVKNGLLKTCLALSLAGLISLLVIFYISIKTGIPVLEKREFIYLSFGSLLALIVGEAFFITGILKSNLTTVAYTALAYPVLTLALDIFRGRAKLKIQELVGLVFLIIGFIIVSRR